MESKVRSILSQLPEGTQTPIIDRFDLDASPVLSIALSGRRDPREVTELARKSLKEDLESLPGVGRVVVEQTWEPGWNSNRLTEDGRRKLGLKT